MKIGSLWGKVLAVDPAATRLKSFGKCRISIFTDCMFSINEDIILEVGQEYHLIHIQEEPVQEKSNLYNALLKLSTVNYKPRKNGDDLPPDQVQIFI